MDKILTVNDIVFKIMTMNWGKDESGKCKAHIARVGFITTDSQSKVGLSYRGKWIRVHRQGKYGLYHPKMSDAKRIAREMVHEYDVVYM